MLSKIAQSFFSDSPVLFYPTAALLLFLLVFLIASIRALRGDKRRFDALAALPLAEEKGHE